MASDDEAKYREQEKKVAKRAADGDLDYKETPSNSLL